MIRRTTLSADHEKHYSVAWGGLCIGHRMKKDVTLADKKLARRVMNKLKALGTPSLGEDGKPLFMNATGDPSYKMNGGGTLELTQEELDYLTKAIESVDWPVVALDDAFNAIDFLNASERVEE